MPTIEVRHLSKAFRYLPVPKHVTLKEVIVRHLFRKQDERKLVEALHDVSFSVEKGQMLGVIGRNGSGKTTLMRILAGIYRQDGGEVSIAGTLTPLLALGAGFHPDLTGRENARVELLVLGVSPKEIERRMERIIEFSEIGDFIDAPVHTYSTGMAMRLAFSAAVSVDPDVLLLDEVLAVGDEIFARKCLASIADFKARGKTIVLVTHQANVVKERCDVALWLDRGRVAAFGAPGEVVGAYQASGKEMVTA